MFKDPLFFTSALTSSLPSDPPEKTVWLLQKIHYDRATVEKREIAPESSQKLRGAF